MSEVLVMVQMYLRMVWRYRWIALLLAILGCLSGWTWVMTLPDTYKVEAQVFLDTSTALQPVLRGIALNTNEQREAAQLMRKTLLVRPNLEDVARKTDMDLQAETPEQFERLVTTLGRSIKVGGTRKGNIFVIAYSNEDPKLAVRVVDALLNVYVEKSLGQSRKDSSKTREFLDAQIKAFEGRLIAAENRLKEFKRQNVGLMPGQGGSYFSRLQGARNQRIGAELQLQELVKRRDALKTELASVVSAVEAGEVPMNLQHPNDARIAKMEADLDQLLLQYTDLHPDVIALRGVLGRLKEERASTLESLRSQEIALEDRLSTNPMYQQLKVSVGRAEADLAAAVARVENYKGKEEQLDKLVDTLPQVEAELVKLNRDYDLDKRNYRALVKRREALKIAREASQTTDDVEFNIIEPPREPLVPSGPNRAKLNLNVFMASLAAGVGLALALALLRPAIYVKEQFAELTDIPVLGSVARIWTPAEVLVRRIEVVSFGAACAGLVGLNFGLLILNERNVDVVDKVQSLVSRLL